MPVIVVAASKGGTGKTTLAAALAVEASNRGREVMLLDADPQQSLARWYELRVAAEDDEPIMLIEAGQPMAPPSSKTWIIIDTPAALVSKIEDAIEMADVVIIPVRPSSMDVDGIMPVVELCNRHDKPFVFVLSQVFAESDMTAGARTFLGTRGEVLDQDILSRPIHGKAMLEGLTGPEYEPRGPVAKEIAALWQTIDELATHKRAARKPAASKKAAS